MYVSALSLKGSQAGKGGWVFVGFFLHSFIF